MQLDAILEHSLRVGPANLPEALARAPGATAKSMGYGGQAGAKGKLDHQALTGITRAVEKFTNSLGVSLKLHVHQDSGAIQAEILDAGGEKVLRQIPPDDILDLAVSIRRFSSLLAKRAL